MSQSKRFQMDGTDWGKVLKGALIAGLAAAIAYLGDALGLVQMTPEGIVGSESASEEMVVDGFPPAMIWWGLSVLINLGWKWFQNNEE